MKFDLDEIKSWNEKKSDWWVPKSGENKIRIIEAPGNSDLPSMFVAYKHYNVGPDKKSIWCPKTTGSKDRDWTKPCPICDYVKSLYDTGDETDKRLAGSMKASQRILLNIVDLSSPENGVRLFECAKTLWEIMLKYWTSKKWGNLADSKAGYDFVINRDGPKSRPNYDRSFAVDDSSPLQDLSWPSQIFDLKKIITIPAYESLKTLVETGEFSEGAGNSSEAVDEDTPPWEDNTPPKSVQTKAAPVKRQSKKPPCFGETYEDGNSDCIDCGWEEACAKACSETSSPDVDMDDLEREIMEELHK